jgi:hypothetical protein
VGVLHIANTFLEEELGSIAEQDLEASFRKHLIYLQLQFLPFLYANKDDSVGVTHMPNPGFWQELHLLRREIPKMHLLSSSDLVSVSRIESWGASRCIAAYAKKRGLQYAMPSWEVVCRVNSKAFSFEVGPQLPHAALLSDAKQAEKWLASFEGPKVLKSCFGVSGKGHLIIDAQNTIPREKIDLFLKREWQAGRPVIAEPWVRRILDFSTQWKISSNKQIHYLGPTLCENDAKGKYLKNSAGDPSKLFGIYHSHLETHKKVAKEALQKMADLGYFGNVGIDAMIYETDFLSKETHLHPIVEINARKTMGWVALELQRLYFPNALISIHFASSFNNECSLLPSAIFEKEGKEHKFHKHLLCCTVPEKGVYN